jgi:predicted kinase
VIVVLNGAFGIGKTTVARLLVRALPGAALFDPEPIGLVLRRLSSFIPLRGRGTDDFQDLPAWRSLTVRGARLVRALRSTVVIPMAFDRLDHLDEIRTGIAAIDPNVRHFCLTAPLATVHQRLRRRGAHAGDPRAAWMYRRAAECVAAHAAAAFAVHVPTEGRSAEEVAGLILERLRE